MKIWKKRTWRHETTGVDGNCQLFGVNIFEYDWTYTGKKINVRDPLYGQKYTFAIYKVMIDGQMHEFAAGEFSMCVWGFFLIQ